MPKLKEFMAEIDNPDASMPARGGPLNEGAASKAPRQERGHQSAPSRMLQFLRDVRAEMRRVSWPTATEVKNTTIITLIAVVFFSVYLFLVDQGLSRLIIGLDWLLEKIAKFVGLG